MYPSFKDLQNAGNKEELFRAHRSLRSELSTVAKIVISGLLILFLNVFFEGYLRLSSVIEGVPDISLRWLALVPAFYGLSLLRGYYDVVYVFGTEGVKQYKGRLSLNKKVPYVKYHDVLALRVHMDPWGRIFNYGDIDLDTAANDDIEMIIEGVANPQELANLLEDLRRNM